MASIFDSIDGGRANLGDKLGNLMSGLGTDKDKVTHGRFHHHWLDAVELDAMYRSDWLAGTVIDAPADDMTREWRTWRGGKNQVAAMQRSERSLGVRRKVNRALKQAGVFGGGAIIIGTGDADPSIELDIDRIPKGGLRYLHNVSRWEIVSGPLNRDPLSPYFGEPEYYTLATETESESPQIHPSRVIRFCGLEPLEISREIDAWGDSRLQRVYEALRNAASTAGGLAALVQEAKVDVVKVTNLTENALDQGWTQRMLARFSMANQGKSLVNMLILDKEEEFEQKKISLADMPKVLEITLQVASGAANIPITRLLGKSPGGLGSTGDGEIRHYYDMLASKQEAELRPALDRLDRALKRHACGATPDSLDYDFAPLWQLTNAEKAAVALQHAQAAQVWAATGLLPFEALAKGAQSLVVREGVYPAFEEALLTAPPVKEPPTPPDDGSKVRNPATLTKAVRAG